MIIIMEGSQQFSVDFGLGAEVFGIGNFVLWGGHVVFMCFVFLRSIFAVLVFSRSVKLTFFGGKDEFCASVFLGLKHK